MPLTVSFSPFPADVPSVRPDAGGGETFAPLIAGLLAPTGGKDAPSPGRSSPPLSTSVADVSVASTPILDAALPGTTPTTPSFAPDGRSDLGAVELSNPSALRLPPADVPVVPSAPAETAPLATAPSRVAPLALVDPRPIAGPYLRPRGSVPGSQAATPEGSRTEEDQDAAAPAAAITGDASPSSDAIPPGAAHLLASAPDREPAHADQASVAKQATDPTRSPRQSGHEPRSSLPSEAGPPARPAAPNAVAAVAAQADGPSPMLPHPGLKPASRSTWTVAPPAGRSPSPALAAEGAGLSVAASPGRRAQPGIDLQATNAPAFAGPPAIAPATNDAIPMAPSTGPDQKPALRYVGEADFPRTESAGPAPTAAPLGDPKPIGPPPSPLVQPALQAFGAAMRRAFADARKPLSAVFGEPLTAVPLTPAPVAAVAPTAATLDTADRRWPQAMAAQIERLRDAQNEGSTRIRMLPDALGPVDVTVRREGEQVHVHFTAAEAQTRQLLADAQPQLAQAADARGLKLGRTEVAGGDAGGERQQRPPAQTPQPSRPAPARSTAAAADPSQIRIA